MGIVVFVAGCRPGRRQEPPGPNAPRPAGSSDGRDASLSEPTRFAATPAVRPLAPLSGAIARAAPTLRFVADGPADIQLCALRECPSPQVFANVTSPFTIPFVSGTTRRVWYWRVVREGKPLTALWTFTLLPSHAPAHIRPPRGLDVDGDGLMDIIFRGALLRGHATGLSRAPLEPFPLGSCRPPPGQIGCDGYGAASPLGDADGDGFGDLAVATHARHEYVARGGADGPSSERDGLAMPAAPSCNAPAIAIGDVNGDGFEDVARCSLLLGSTDGLAPADRFPRA